MKKTVHGAMTARSPIRSGFSQTARMANASNAKVRKIVAGKIIVFNKRFIGQRKS
ncbi:hypothetical protein [Collimonas arenae]|uniref:hypothetical protein n=1 Tax=Collimonas arenae TaxID=279058 RepID=UPI001F4881B0|nr:hypothetical protein [Collimonas arenae]